MASLHVAHAGAGRAPLPGAGGSVQSAVGTWPDVPVPRKSRRRSQRAGSESSGKGTSACAAAAEEAAIVRVGLAGSRE
jgi:hypothetical protein